MPIKEIQEYAKLRTNGDSTMSERMEMLIKHRAALKEKITKSNEHLKNLNDKINYYKAILSLPKIKSIIIRLYLCLIILYH